MKSSKIADVVELALIELEYAVADFLHDTPIGDVEARRRELEALLSKLLRANQTVRTAIASLDAPPLGAAAIAPPRRPRRRRFAA